MFKTQGVVVASPSWTQSRNSFGTNYLARYDINAHKVIARKEDNNFTDCMTPTVGECEL